MNNNQPYTIKCLSLQGVLLRISRFEFEKKILIYPNVKLIFKENAADSIIANQQKLENRFQMHRNILQSCKTDLSTYKQKEEFNFDNSSRQNYESSQVSTRTFHKLGEVGANTSNFIISLKKTIEINPNKLGSTNCTKRTRNYEFSTQS